jgi:hypothetical protein
MKYLLINVFGDCGYSLMVHTKYNNNDDVINACLKNDLFKDECDADCCSVVEADDYDIKMFADCIFEI